VTAQDADEAMEQFEADKEKEITDTLGK